VRPVSSQEAEEALTSELFESTPLSYKKEKKQAFPREIAAGKEECLQQLTYKLLVKETKWLSLKQ
jgi:hypothetical protein